MITVNHFLQEILLALPVHSSRNEHILFAIENLIECQLLLLSLSFLVFLYDNSSAVSFHLPIVYGFRITIVKSIKSSRNINTMNIAMTLYLFNISIPVFLVFKKLSRPSATLASEKLQNLTAH